MFCEYIVIDELQRYLFFHFRDDSKEDVFVHQVNTSPVDILICSV